MKKWLLVLIIAATTGAHVILGNLRVDGQGCWVTNKCVQLREPALIVGTHAIDISKGLVHRGNDSPFSVSKPHKQVAGGKAKRVGFSTFDAEDNICFLDV